MTSLLFRWLVSAVAVGLTAALLSGIHVDGGFATVLWIALVLGLVNAIFGTAVRILTLPIIVVTLGLFALVINAAMLAFTAWLLGSLSIDSFWWALLGSILITVFSLVGDALTGRLR